MSLENIIDKKTNSHNKCFLDRLKNKIIPYILSLSILAGAELLFNKKFNAQENYGKLTFQQVLKDNLTKVAYHDLGKIYVSLIDNANMNNEDWGKTAQIIYPNGMYGRENMKLWSLMFMAKNWINSQGEKQQETLWTPENTYPGFAKAIYMNTYRRWAPPTIICDGINVSKPYIGIIDENLPSDIYVDWKFKTMGAIGITSHHQTYSFTNQNHDDYVIIKQTLTFFIKSLIWQSD